MTDRELRQQVGHALTGESALDHPAIEVSVETGIVTLRGNVRSHLEKAIAECVVLCAPGAAGVANNLEVRPKGRS